MKILINYCGIYLIGDKEETYLYANFLIGKYDILDDDVKNKPVFEEKITVFTKTRGSLTIQLNTCNGSHIA